MKKVYLRDEFGLVVRTLEVNNKIFFNLKHANTGTPNEAVIVLLEEFLKQDYSSNFTV